MSRPKKEPGHKKEFKHTIHLTENEYKLIKSKAERMKTSISGFLREASVRSVLIEPDQNLAKLLSELSKIGTNLNQITKQINATGVNLSEEQKKALNSLYLKIDEIKKTILK
jgi:hypothetical protein